MTRPPSRAAARLLALLEVPALVAVPAVLAACAYFLLMRSSFFRQGTWSAARNTTVATPCVASNGSAAPNATSAADQENGCTKPMTYHPFSSRPYSRADRNP